MILTPLPWGTYRLTQPFGVDPATYAQFGLNGHNGLDFGPVPLGSTSTVVYAPHEGFVHLGNEGTQGYGQYVQIDGLPYNKEGMCRHSILAHLAKFIVTEGQFISAGDIIGIMGSTGFSTGVHTHWTYKLKKNGQTLNYDNGFKGAIDVSKYLIVWVNT